MTDEHVVRVLRLAAIYDVREYIEWHCAGFGVALSVAAGDAIEPLGPAELPAFERAIADAAGVTEGDATYGPQLFIARTRGERPANGDYPPDPRLWPLFDAVGPSNPVAPRLVEEVP